LVELVSVRNCVVSILVQTARRIRRMEDVACMGEGFGFWWKNLKEGNHVENLGVSRRDDNIKNDLTEIRCEGLD
jgi:hypothetical protein